MNKSIAAEEITSGIDGEKIRTHDVITSPNQPMIAGLAQNDLITLNNLEEFSVTGGGGLLTFTRNAGSEAPYMLTTSQLNQINASNKWPFMIAVIGGTPYPDITYTATGSPGSFIAIQVNLHNDGSGVNLDTTVVQFS